MKIMLDTSFLITALKYKIDIVSELRGHELYTNTNVIRELEGLSKGKGKNAIFARIALGQTKKFKILAPKIKDTDKSLVNYSKNAYIIATQDRQLKKHLKKSIYIRQKKYLVIP